MDTLILKIRNAARAVVIQDGQILLLHKKDESGNRYALPGGAPDLGETLEAALQRECLEEINSQVEIVNLLCVAEVLKKSSSQPGTSKHQFEFLFQCRLPENYQPQNGIKPDKHQVDVIWFPLAQLGEIKILPQSLAKLLIEVNFEVKNIYFGMVD